MDSERTHKAGMQAVAKLVFAALSFLLLTSFLAWPCLQGRGDLFVSVARTSAATPRTAWMTSAPLMSSLPSLTPVPEKSSVPISSPLILQSIAKPILPAASYSFVARSTQAQAVRGSSRMTASVPGSWTRVATGGEYCTEHKLFKPKAGVPHAFDGLATTDRLLRLVATLVVALGFPEILAAAMRRLVRPRPGWVRMRSLPFASSDPPHLAYFAAQRDA